MRWSLEVAASDRHVGAGPGRQRAVFAILPRVSVTGEWDVEAIARSLQIEASAGGVRGGGEYASVGADAGLGVPAGRWVIRGSCAAARRRPGARPRSLRGR